MRAAGVEDVRRTGFFTVVLRKLDDLGAPGEHSVSGEVATQAVCRLRQRGLTTSLVGMALVAGAATGIALSPEGSGGLLATGTAAVGTVVGPSGGLFTAGDAVDVRFTVDGVEHIRSLDPDDSAGAPEASEQVTVYYDPQDPGRFASPGMHDNPAPAFFAGVFAMVAALVLLPSGLVGLVRWQLRLSSARRYGWRRGRVRAEGERHHSVRFEDGTTLTLSTTRPVAAPVPAEFRTGEVLVGGRDRHLTVLFTTGPVLASARAFPQ